MARDMQCSNMQTLVILLSLQLGWGLWLMPQAFATFGWWAILVITGSAAATWMSGSLYGRLCRAVPDATSLADIGSAFHQRTGRHMAAGFVVITQIMMCLVLQLAAATSLQHTLKGITPQSISNPDGMLPLWLAQVIVSCAVATASQLRQLAQLSSLCYVGNIAQLIAACLLAAGMLSGASQASTCPTQRPAWLHDVVTLLGVVFAYGGQYAYVDVAHQMRRKTSFASMQHLSASIMTVLYLLFGAMVFAARGPAAAELQVFASNGPAALSRTAVGCVLVQTLVQLVISVYICTTTLVTWYLRCRKATQCTAVSAPLQRQGIRVRTPSRHSLRLKLNDFITSCMGGSSRCQTCSHDVDPTPEVRRSTCDTQCNTEAQRDLAASTVPPCADRQDCDSATGANAIRPQYQPPLVPLAPSQQQQQQQQQVASSASTIGLQSHSDLGGHVSSAGRVVWCVGSCASIAVSAVVSSFVPSIKHLAGILAAGSDLMLAYGVPCLFAPVLLRDVVPVRHRAWVVCALGGVFVVSLLASIAGVTVSVLSFASGSRD